MRLQMTFQPISPNPEVKTYGLRLPGKQTRCILVEAESLEDALRIANAPAGTTGNGLFPEVAEMMVERGIAVRFVCELVTEGDLA
jgi:hypothetical protein